MGILVTGMRLVTAKPRVMTLDGIRDFDAPNVVQTRRSDLHKIILSYPLLVSYSGEYSDIQLDISTTIPYPNVALKWPGRFSCRGVARV